MELGAWGLEHGARSMGLGAWDTGLGEGETLRRGDFEKGRMEKGKCPFKSPKGNI